MKEVEMEKLKQFFGAYFHQDWLLDAAHPDEVVEAFLREGHDAAELAQLGRLIDEYSRQEVDDAALERALFTELGCYYMPSADGISARKWLQDVASKVSQGRAS
jgi:hypothetical protein